MLEIITNFGTFGRPKDLYQYMKTEKIEKVHVIVKYCLYLVDERDMNIGEVMKWSDTFISPVAGSLQDAIAWIKIGLE